jgi:hypothetical protein
LQLRSLRAETRVLISVVHYSERVSHFVRRRVGCRESRVLADRARSSSFRVAHAADVRESERRTARPVAAHADVDAGQKNRVVGRMQPLALVINVLVLAEVAKRYFRVLINLETIAMHQDRVKHAQFDFDAQARIPENIIF